MREVPLLGRRMQLASLVQGTPIIVSRLPANVELAAAHPQHVHLVDRVEDVPAAFAAIRTQPPDCPAIPTWDDVAARLEEHYSHLVPTAAR